MTCRTSHLTGSVYDRQYRQGKHKIGKSSLQFLSVLVCLRQGGQGTFRLAFSTDELRHFDLATIEFEKRDWLDSNRLTHRFADLVVSVRLKDGPKVSVTLVVEHKSWPDSNLMELLLYYQSLIYVNENDRVVLPPVVVYHGRQLSWPKWHSFQQYKLEHLPESFVNEFGAEMIDFGIRLVNLRDATMRRRVAKLSLEIRLYLQTLADIWELDEDAFVSLVEQSSPLPENVRDDFVLKAAIYLRKVQSEIKFDKLVNKIQERTGDQQIMQKLAEEWSWLTEDEIRHTCRLEGRDEGEEIGLKKGLKKGRDEGREEMSRKFAERLIQDGMDDQSVSGYTDLSPDEVRKIRNGH